MNIQLDPIPLASGRLEARAWARVLRRYCDPNDGRGAVEIAITLVPFTALWIAMVAALQQGYWPALVLALPTAGFLVRLFMVQHDCSHGSFFRTPAANRWAGRVLGVLTMTPFGLWRRTHTLHHASSGSLDRRGVGDVDTLTVAEYRAKSRLGRALYRLYRHPLVMFGLGPAYLFILQHRLPVGMMRRGWQPWLSAMGTNVAIALTAGILIWLIGLQSFLLVHLPVVLIAATVGVWLFFVQHQFEHTTWDREPEWNWSEAALYGSSHYDLPPVIRWFSANIGVHHVHHLCSGIPCYRLGQVLRDHPELGEINRLTLRESLRCVRLILWDEHRRQLVGVQEIRRDAPSCDAPRSLTQPERRPIVGPAKTKRSGTAG